MSEQQAAPAHCEHHYETHLLGGHPITVRICLFCRTPDWPDLHEQAVQLYQWGRDEELAGRPPRTTLNAYDMPHDAAEHRLRLAHQARRAKEHQLDGIRRALCDVGAMQDDDPYSHADLEDVIRQAFTPEPAHNAGPTVRECAETGARWRGGEKAGEGQ